MSRTFQVCCAAFRNGQAPVTASPIGCSKSLWSGAHTITGVNSIRLCPRIHRRSATKKLEWHSVWDSILTIWTASVSPHNCSVRRAWTPATFAAWPFRNAANRSCCISHTRPNAMRRTCTRGPSCASICRREPVPRTDTLPHWSRLVSHTGVSARGGPPQTDWLCRHE